MVDYKVAQESKPHTDFSLNLIRTVNKARFLNQI